MLEMGPSYWAVAILVGLLVGFSKTGIPGLGIVIVPLMLFLFTSKLSVGALLPLLIVGDLFAIAYYRHHADWSRLWPLYPWILLGMGAGALVMQRISDSVLQTMLGVLVLALAGLEVARARGGWSIRPQGWAFAAFFGVTSGFATTVGNVAGSIMSIYLLAVGFDKEKFLGTGAWYYLSINSLKIPLFYSLGMITQQTLTFGAIVAVPVMLGALFGRRALVYIPQKVFNRCVIGLAFVAAAIMIAKA